MMEGKVPDMPRVELPLLQTVDDLSVEVLVFENPKNGLRCEDIPIKDVLCSDEIDDFLMAARTQDVVEGFQFVDSVVLFEGYGRTRGALGDDG